MEDNAVLISIHPDYAVKILSGEKRLEFRRSWTTKPVDTMVIYATAPVQRIVAIAEIKQVYVGTRVKLWAIAKNNGGAISRRKLYSYLAGSKNPVAIQLVNVKQIEGGVDPKSLFGNDFRPPQSFRYLGSYEYSRIAKMIKS